MASCDIGVVVEEVEWTERVVMPTGVTHDFIIELVDQTREHRDIHTAAVDANSPAAIQIHS